MSELQITRKNNDVVMGWFGRVSIAVWTTAPDEGVDWFREEMELGKKKLGAHFAHVPVLGPTTPPWSAKARTGLMQIVKDMEPELDCVVPIMTATGFMAATMRAMGAGMLMLLPRSRTEIKIVGNVDDAAKAIMRIIPGQTPVLTGSVLAGVLQEMESSPRVAA